MVRPSPPPAARCALTHVLAALVDATRKGLIPAADALRVIVAQSYSATATGEHVDAFVRTALALMCLDRAASTAAPTLHGARSALEAAPPTAHVQPLGPPCFDTSDPVSVILRTFPSAWSSVTDQLKAFICGDDGVGDVRDLPLRIRVILPLVIHSVFMPAPSGAGTPRRAAIAALSRAAFEHGDELRAMALPLIAPLLIAMLPLLPPEDLEAETVDQVADLVSTIEDGGVRQALVSALVVAVLAHVQELKARRQSSLAFIRRAATLFSAEFVDAEVAVASVAHACTLLLASADDVVEAEALVKVAQACIDQLSVEDAAPCACRAQTRVAGLVAVCSATVAASWGVCGAEALRGAAGRLLDHVGWVCCDRRSGADDSQAASLEWPGVARNLLRMPCVAWLWWFASVDKGTGARASGTSALAVALSALKRRASRAPSVEATACQGIDGSALPVHPWSAEAEAGKPPSLRRSVSGSSNRSAVAAVEDDTVDMHDAAAEHEANVGDVAEAFRPGGASRPLRSEAARECAIVPLGSREVHLQLVMAASLLLHDAADVRGAAVELFAVIADRIPSAAAMFIPQICSALTVEPVPSLRARMLFLLPRLGAEPACVSPVLQLLQSCLEGPHPLPAVAVSALGQLWSSNPRVGTRLFRALSATGTDEPDACPTDVQVARAAVICRVCRQSPTQGVQLASMIQQLVEADDAGVVALGLHSISALVEADCMDICKVLRVLSKTRVLDAGAWFSEEEPATATLLERQVSGVAVCALLGGAAWLFDDVAGPSAPYSAAEQTGFRVVRQLLRLAALQDSVVAGAAAQALRRFPVWALGVDAASAGGSSAVDDGCAGGLDPAGASPSSLPLTREAGLEVCSALLDSAPDDYDAHGRGDDEVAKLIKLVVEGEARARRWVQGGRVAAASARGGRATGGPAKLTTSQRRILGALPEPGMIGRAAAGPLPQAVRGALSGAGLLAGAAGSSDASLLSKTLVDGLADVDAGMTDWVARDLLTRAWLSFMRRYVAVCDESSIGTATGKLVSALHRSGVVAETPAALGAVASGHEVGEAELSESAQTGHNACVALGALGCAVGSTSSSGHALLPAVIDMLLSIVLDDAGGNTHTLAGAIAGLGVAMLGIGVADTPRLGRALSSLLSALRRHSSSWVKFSAATAVARVAANLAGALGDGSFTGSVDVPVLSGAGVASDSATVFCAVLDELTGLGDDAHATDEVVRCGAMLGAGTLAEAVASGMKTPAGVDVLRRTFASLSDVAARPSAVRTSSVWIGLAPVAVACLRWGVVDSGTVATYLDSLISELGGDAAPPSVVLAVLPAFVDAAMRAGVVVGSEERRALLNCCSTTALDVSSAASLRRAALWGLANVLGGRCGMGLFATTDGSLVGNPRLSPLVDRHAAMLVSDTVAQVASSHVSVAAAAAWTAGVASAMRAQPPDTFDVGVSDTSRDAVALAGFCAPNTVLCGLLRRLDDIIRPSVGDFPIIRRSLAALENCPLPPAQLGRWLNRFFIAGGDDAVRRSCVRIAVRNAANASAVEWLASLYDSWGAGTLDLAVQLELLQSLPRVAEFLPAERVGHMLVRTGKCLFESQLTAAELQVSCMRAIAALVQRTEADDGAAGGAGDGTDRHPVADVAVAAFCDELWPMLPTPVRRRGGRSVLSQGACRVLRAAAGVVRHLPRARTLAAGGVLHIGALDTSEVAAVNSQKAVFVRCVLAQVSEFGFAELAPCRLWCVGPVACATATEASRGNEQAIQRVAVLQTMLPCIGEAAASLSQVQRVLGARWVLELLETIEAATESEWLPLALLAVSTGWVALQHQKTPRVMSFDPSETAGSSRKAAEAQAGAWLDRAPVGAVLSGAGGAAFVDPCVLRAATADLSGVGSGALLEAVAQEGHWHPAVRVVGWAAFGALTSLQWTLPEVVLDATARVGAPEDFADAVASRLVGLSLRLAQQMALQRAEAVHAAAAATHDAVLSTLLALRPQSSMLRSKRWELLASIAGAEAVRASRCARTRFACSDVAE